MRIAPIVLLLALTAARARAQEYWPTHEWRTAPPEAQGLDSNVLAEALEYVRAHAIPIHSLTIVRNGYVVLDACFWPYQCGQPHDVASVTKSVTATLAGMAVARGALALDEPVLRAFGLPPDPDVRKNGITVEDLLTMASGLDCRFGQGEITLAEMTRSPDWVGFVLGLPMAWPPGAHYEYCSPGMHLLSALVGRAVRQPTLDFARRELFAPLGIERVIWPADPQGVARGWGDLHLRPDDMARLGYFWLHDGRWDGRQLLPPWWMAAATRPHSHPGFGGGQEYGYGFWLYPERNPPVYEALGRGGQRISVVPAANLVVVFTGGSFEPGDIGNFIARALGPQPLPPNPAATARLDRDVAAAARPPAPQAVPSLPTRARTVSGRSFAFGANPLDLESLSLAFAGDTGALLTLGLRDRTDGPRPVGLDGVPRLSPDGRYGLPVAVSGSWQDDSTFVLDYDEVANINRYTMSLTFAADGVNVDVQVRERSGLVNAHFPGQAGP